MSKFLMPQDYLNLFKEKEMVELNFQTDMGFTIIGFFYYRKANISHKCASIPRDLFNHLWGYIQKNKLPSDNKVVYICKDNINFGTENFAIHFYDYNVRIGKWEDVEFS